MSSLCVGVSALRFGLESKWEVAVLCVVIAAFLDGIDGRVARILGASSHFGAELDSLCDFVNFGVVPSLLMYCWSFQESPFKALAWVVVLLFIVCMSLRLARFNTGLVDKDSMVLSKSFFIGVPAPIGAMLLLTPIIMSFEIAPLLDVSLDIKANSLLLMGYQVVLALLLASRMPTFSLKDIIIKPQYVWIFLFCSCLLIIGLIIYPWYMMPMLALTYISTLPFSIMVARKIN
jgi:CDP-diacylglycerol---serine O-phosphatidyltransferase